MRELPSPEEMASRLLSDNRGIARDAETIAWAHQRKYDPKSDSFSYWFYVAKCIIDKTEYPPVARHDPISFRSVLTEAE